MRFKRTLATLALVTLIAPGIAWLQETDTESPNESTRYSGSEKVGETMWRVRPHDTPYDKWLETNRERIPTFEGLLIQDARTEPLEPWDDMGVDGLYIKMADYQITDGWILEIPAHGKTKKQRHMFEAGMYFFGGPGYVEIKQEGRRPQRIPFKYRTLFSIPLNVQYQIVNKSDEPVRVVAVTSFPFVLNSMNSEEFVFNNPFVFDDRYNADEDYTTVREHPEENLTITNVVPDAVEFELDEYDHRGKGTTNMHWSMSGNSMIDLHVSEMPSGVYKKAHRHSSDAFILLVDGEGYSLTWPEGRYEDRIRVDWQEGTIFVPPIYWYHQHLNPSDASARYMAINAPILVTTLGLRFSDQLDPDLPHIKEEFDAEVTKRQAANSEQD